MSQDNVPYLYNEGIKSLAQDSVGTESIHMGIRPFGFHAGNLVSLYVYPFLFCEEMEKLGKPVQFRFFVSINDYEQDALGGPDVKKYPFNIFPQKTTLQFLEDGEGCHAYMIDHWFPIIRRSLQRLTERFPEVQIYFIKNSELKNDLKFKETLTRTIYNPIEQADIFKRFTDKEVLDAPLAYAGVVCPVCKKTKGKTVVSRVNDEHIRWECETCGISLHAPYMHFDYWFYHKPLFTARLSIFNIDITFSGDDHFSEGDFRIRQEFIKSFNPSIKSPKMFFGPLVMAPDGTRMSKTQGNALFGNTEKLLEKCRTLNEDKIFLTSDLISEDIQ